MLRKSSRPDSGFELFSWFFMRVSGALLIVLVLVHLAFTHFVFGVDRIDFNMVASRWATPTWRVFDILMLTLALLHGGNGIRILIDDYIRSRGWRMFAISTLYTLGFFLLVLGGLVILTFRAQ